MWGGGGNGPSVRVKAWTGPVNWPTETLKENSKGVEEGNWRGSGSKWVEEHARRRRRRGTIMSREEREADGAGGGGMLKRKYGLSGALRKPP